VRSADEFREVQRLIALGMNDCAISRLTAIPRPTIEAGAAIPRQGCESRGHRHRAVSFISLPCRQRPTPTCSVCTSETGACRGYDECGSSGLHSTPNIRRSWSDADKRSTWSCPTSALRGQSTWRKLRRGHPLLQALALLLAATRPWAETPPAHRPRAMAAGNRGQRDRGVHLRPDLQRRLPRRRE
jgi:hypothetical protein